MQIFFNVHKKSEGDDFMESFDVSSSSKSRKKNNKKELIEKNKKLKPDFEQNLFSKTTKCI